MCECVCVRDREKRKRWNIKGERVFIIKWETKKINIEWNDKVLILIVSSVLTLNILLIWSISPSPGNNGFPVNISAKIHPTAHRSKGVEYSFLPRRSSVGRSKEAGKYVKQYN